MDIEGFDPENPYNVAEFINKLAKYYKENEFQHADFDKKIVESLSMDGQELLIDLVMTMNSWM